MKQKLLLAVLLICAVFPAAAQLNSTEFEGEVNYYLGSGFQIPLFGSVYPGRGSEDISLGIISNRLIDSLYITADADDRFSMLLDYDSGRLDFLGTGNEYSLMYSGKQYEFVKTAFIGNSAPLFPENSLFSLHPGSKNGLSMFLSGSGGHASVNALLRYDNTERVQKKFSGNREISELNLNDVDYVKRKYYFIPDSGVKISDLVLYIHYGEGPEALLASYVRLYPEKDFSYDEERGWILLNSGLSSGSSLIAAYSKKGDITGSPALGINAFINSDGQREDFNSSSHPEQFRNIEDDLYLILQEKKINSFWELKNAYYIPGIRGNNSVEIKNISLYRTSDETENNNYTDVLANYIFNSKEGVFFFIAEDESGNHPRPFPGEYPFISSAIGDNPYSAVNPVYSELAETGINSLKMTLSANTGSFFLSFNIIKNSVEVSADGSVLPDNYYSIDYDAGTITFSGDAVAATSLVTVSWDEGGVTGEDEAIISALSLTIEDDLNIGLHAKAEFPLVEKFSLDIEDETHSEVTAGITADYLLGEKSGNYFEISAAAGISSRIPGVTDRRSITSMDSKTSYSVSMSASQWQIAAASSLLPGFDPAVNLSGRGELRYTSFYEDSLIQGSLLHSIDWDVPESQRYSYSSHSGPYNTSDTTEGGNPRSIALEYFFESGTASPYVNAVIPLDDIDLDFSDQLTLTYRTADVSGELPKLYIELLSSCQEDIDGDDLLDGEYSAEDPGFQIIPTDGTSTVIGVGYDGNPDDDTDSEDLNQNGVLDPEGPYAGDIEEGIVVIQTGDDCSINLVQTNEWITEVIDMSAVITENNSIMNRIEALRITLGVPDASVGADTSGAVLINDIIFEGVPFINNNPALADTQFISPAAKGLTSLKDIYPTEFDSVDNKALMWKLTSNLASGDSLSLDYSPLRMQELRYYKRIVYYAYKPLNSSFPETSKLTLGLELFDGSKTEKTISISKLSEGWNKIEIPLSSGSSTIVNGQPADETAGTGITSEITSYSFKIHADGESIPAGNYLLLDELSTNGYSMPVDAEGKAGAAFSFANEIITLTGSAGGSLNAAAEDGIRLKSYELSGRIGGSFFSLLPFYMSGNFGSASADFDIEHRINSGFSAMLGFSDSRDNWIPDAAVIYHAKDSYFETDSGNRSVSASMEEKLYLVNPEMLNISYSFIQRLEKTEANPDFTPYLEHSGLIDLSRPSLELKVNADSVHKMTQVSIPESTPLTFPAAAVSADIFKTFISNPVRNRFNDSSRLETKYNFPVNIRLAQSLKWENIITNEDGSSENMDQAIEIEVPISIGKVILTPGIYRTDVKNLNTYVDFSTAMYSQFNNLFSPLSGEGWAEWLKAPLNQLQTDPLNNGITNAELEDRIKVNLDIDTDIAFIPDSFQAFFNRRGSINSSLETAEQDFGGKVQKNFFHNFGNNNILNANSGFSFTMTDDWLYQERSWKTDISGFLLFISPSAQWKADLFLQYSGRYTETDLPDLDTTYNKVINSSALRVKTSLSLSRPVSYAENKLFNLFTGSIHNDSIEIEAGSFQQSENPLFGSSRILFRCTLTHTSELFMEDHFSLEALLRVQGGREEFWLSDGPEYRDSAGIELGIAAHQYF